MTLYFRISVIVIILFSIHKMISPSLSAELNDANVKGYSLLYVDSQKGEPYKTLRLAIVDRLITLGFGEQYLKIRYLSLGNREDILKRIFKEGSRPPFDVIFSAGTYATNGLKKYVMNDPQYKVIFGAVTDPIGIGVIEGFDVAPRHNFTGVSYPVSVVDRLRFIQQVLPKATKIGYIHSNMLQSKSYTLWLKEALKEDEFKDLELIERTVEFIPGDGGTKRMARYAKYHAEELDPIVDLFLSPNDQMGVQADFAREVTSVASKPLIGLGKKDVMENWGAMMSFYPDIEKSGQKLALMIARVLQGTSFNNVPATQPEAGVAIDLNLALRHGITFPKNIISQAGKNIIHPLQQNQNN